MRRPYALAFVLALVLGSGIAIAADPWVHIRVDDGDENVRVNVPLSLVRTMITSVETDELRDGRIQIDDAEFDDVDLRAMLEAVRDTEDAEFVRIRDNDSVQPALLVVRNGISVRLVSGLMSR